MIECLTDTQLDNIIHALGLTKRGGKRPRWAYRNHYNATNLSPDFWSWDSLKDKGYAKGMFGEGSTTFRLTTAVLPLLPEDIRKRIPKSLLT